LLAESYLLYLSI